MILVAQPPALQMGVELHVTVGFLMEDAQHFPQGPWRAHYIRRALVAQIVWDNRPGFTLILPSSLPLETLQKSILQNGALASGLF